MFRLEDIVENKNMTVLDQIFHSINEPIPDHDKVIRLIDENDTKTNRREHREVLKWEELCQVDVDLTKQFWDMSRSYGYYHDLVDDGLCID
jgi:predicted N-acyltransferase